VQRAELQDDSHGELVQERRYGPLLYLSIMIPNESTPFSSWYGSPANETLYLFTQPIRELVTFLYNRFKYLTK
jgi:hypothetical protein